MHTVEEMTRAGCTTRRGIRFWEDKGLLGQVERSAGGTRQFTPEQLDKARIIAAAQFGGWSLDDIEQMLAGWNRDTYKAILIRLSDQSHTATQLGKSLPKPESKNTVIEYDL